jgi:hypothetical protein
MRYNEIKEISREYVRGEIDNDIVKTVVGKSIHEEVQRNILVNKWGIEECQKYFKRRYGEVMVVFIEETERILNGMQKNQTILQNGLIL